MAEEKSIKERLEERLKQAISEVEKTNQPTSVEIGRNDRWTLQLLVVPPSTRTYGAVEVKRDQAVLLTVRSNNNWRNNITLPDARAITALKEIIDWLVQNEELYNAVLSVLTGRAKPIQRTVITL